MKIALLFKEEIAKTDVASLLKKKIIDKGFDIDNKKPDVVVFVGGDGTFLRAVQAYIPLLDKVSFIGINKGSLGFYADYLIEDVDNALDDLASGNYVKHSFKLLETKINKSVLYSVNEMRIENPFHTLTAKLYVNDQYFETYRGNGVAIATTMGSSAYNKSLGGAVVEPTVETLQISEIAPINNRVYHSFGSSLVLSGNNTIRIEADFSDAVVGYDHLTAKEKPHVIEVKLSDKKVTLLYKKNHNFISHLHEAFYK